MRRVLLTLLILAVTVSVADSRRRHHGYFVRMRAAPVFLAPGGAMAMPQEFRSRGSNGEQFVPADWKLEPASPDWQGRRYVAPDGNAWLALYGTPAAANDTSEHFKGFAFADGEQITFIHGERDRLTVSGLKGDRIFYRKVALACGGTLWRHVAVEYPAQEKRGYDAMIERMSRGFERIAEDSCGESLFTHPQPASAPADKPAEPAPQPH